MPGQLDPHSALVLFVTRKFQGATMASKRVSSMVVSILGCVLLMVAFSGSATAHNTDIDALLPSNLLPPKGQHVQQILVGIGQQIYTYNGSAWALTNVSADLYDDRGKKVGCHIFLGKVDSGGGKATWITFDPPTRVTGKTLVSDVGPFPTSGDSINWLLVQATSNSGTDNFMGATTYVQRIFTHAGLAPSAAGNTGDVFASNYVALYKYSDA